MPLPAGWVDLDRSGPATDLTLAVLLVNTVDELEQPADRMLDLQWLSGALTTVGHAELGAALRPRDLPRLRGLRAAMRAAFTVTTSTALAGLLNPLLAAPGARLQLVTGDDPRRVSLAVAHDSTGIYAIEARLPFAVATFAAEHGVGRLGVCASDPCRCVFVDRTRGASRRYCCSYCNDRAAARAYRRRKSTSS